jgi:hypothetical protein
VVERVGWLWGGEAFGARQFVCGGQTEVGAVEGLASQATDWEECVEAEEIAEEDGHVGAGCFL